MLYGCKVYTERAVMAAVSRGTSYVTTKQRCKYTTWMNIQKRAKENGVIHSESHATRAQ